MKLTGFRLVSLLVVLTLGGCQVSPSNLATITPSLFSSKKIDVSWTPPKPQATPTSTDGSSPTIQIAPLASTEIGLYDLLELDIQTNLAVENPYDKNEFDLRIRFTSPSGKKKDIGAFWSVEYSQVNRFKKFSEGWKARFTPTETGTWTAQVYVANSELTGNSVMFNVTPSENPGFVRIDAENPRYFAFDNGDFFFPIGINLAWWCGTCDPLETYRQLMDDFHAQGGNTIRVWMASWSFGIETRSSLGTYNAYEAWLLDQVFKMAEDRGMYVILVLLNCLDYSTWQGADWSMNLYNQAQGGPLASPEEFATNPQAIYYFEQRLSYIIDRWGYSPNLLAWEWWNEVNLSAISDTLLMPWLKEVTAFLHGRDVNDHLVTNSYAIRDQSPVWQMPEMDIVMKHEYTDQIASPNRDLGDRALADFNRISSAAPVKPVLMGEFGYSTNYEEEISETTGVHLHNGIWATTFAGYAGSGMYWNWDTVLQRYHLWYHFKGLSTFLHGVDLPEYAPFTTLEIKGPDGSAGDAVAMVLKANDLLLWIRNNEYTAQTLLGEHKYVPSRLEGQTITLQGIPSGEYTVTWFDTFQAKWMDSETVSTSGKDLVIPIPAFNRDLAAKIVKN